MLVPLMQARMRVCAAAPIFAENWQLLQLAGPPRRRWASQPTLMPSLIPSKGALPARVRRHGWPRALLQALVIAAALVACYFAAPLLPARLGWENGVIENTQVVLLLLGGLLAARYALRAPVQPQRAFWWVISPLWGVLALRELSWGATLLPPLHLDPLTGPTFSSSQQLFYKPLITPALLVLVAGLVVVLLVWRAYRLLPLLWQCRGVPWSEMALVVACMLVSTAAEGHMGLAIQGLGHGASQLLEEFAELLAYLMLLVGQCRVHQALDHGAALGARAQGQP